MKYVIAYWSRYGNGKRIVDRLEQKLSGKGDVVVICTKDASNIPDADMYVFSSPAEKFTIPKSMRTFIKKMEGIEGKKCALVNTHGAKRNWLGKMEKLVSKKNMVVVARVDFRVEGDVETGKGLMDGWESVLDDFADEL